MEVGGAPATKARFGKEDEMRVSVKNILMSAALALVVGLPAWSRAGSDSPPETVNLGKVTFQIVEARFVTQLRAMNGSFNEQRPQMYRGLVLTLKITKPPGEELTLRSQDINLHYRYGTRSDVAICFGMSSFSGQQDQDRVMAFYRRGYGKATTGTATTKKGTVYVDLFFQHMEQSTSSLYLFVAQPVGTRFTTAGWKK